jgi:hypothetical protein
MRGFPWAAITILGWGLICGDACAVEPPRLRELRTQTVNGVTYFNARFDPPADLWLPNENAVYYRNRPDLAQEPRLIPQDDQTLDVVFVPNEFPNEWSAGPDRNAAWRAFDFYGRRIGTGRAKLLLLYAHTHPEGQGRFTSVELPIEIDFNQARAEAVTPEAAQRRPDRLPAYGDVEGWWAVGQAHRFAVLEALSPDFSFYGFARTAIRRHYQVSARELNRIGPPRDAYSQLYETTTGAAAITESLQLRRMLGERRPEGPRTIDVAKVRGIDIAEHPWAKMMEGRQPDAEPLAKLVPHDNYYLHFKSFAKFIEMGDLLDQWGTSAVRAYEVQATDYRLKERYEKQLCLKTSLLGRTFGPLVIKGMAVTGNDGFLREGSDLAVIFHVANHNLFRTGVEPYLRDARREFGDQLRETKDDYRGVTIEGFVTPRREVSLYRAAFDEFVVYANSPVGVRRILDTRAGRLRPLADSLDFQYMRTVFRLSDPAEDGFVFLPDAFIRQLVGPASKIKEKRRVEGLAGLTMATNAALYHAWLHGKPPADLETLLRSGDLQPADLATPDQSAVAWDGAKQQAVSDRYNTIHFATPLIELPIDTISREEQQDYDRFRAQYLGLWRQYFDPVGLRLKFDREQVRVETYILPLIQSTQYNELRRMTGDGTVSSGVFPPTPKTAAQLLVHVSPQHAREWQEMLTHFTNFKGPFGLGDAAVIRFDDSPAYAKVLALAERDLVDFTNTDEWMEAIFRMPVTFGVQVRNPPAFAGMLTALRTIVMNLLPGGQTWDPLEPAYKGVSIVRVQATSRGVGQVAGQRQDNPDRFLPAVYYALVDDTWYVSLQEQPIKDMIDRSELARAQPAPANASDAKPVNSALHIAPETARATKEFARRYLEQEARQRALANAQVWHAFARAGLIDGQAGESARQAVLYRYLGYVPVSPEGAAYRYDPRTDEVTNTRHGSPRQPTPRHGVDPASPIGQLLEQFRTLDVDLTFREDGIHTTLILKKK